MKSNLLYSVVNHLSSSNIILLLCSNKRSEANVHLRISNGVKHPHILFTLLSSCLFLSFLYLSDGIFFLYLSSILISSFRYFQVASFFILVDIRKVKSYIFHPLLFIFCLTYISTSFQIYHSPPQLFVRGVIIFATFIP